MGAQEWIAKILSLILFGLVWCYSIKLQVSIFRCLYWKMGTLCWQNLWQCWGTLPGRSRSSRNFLSPNITWVSELGLRNKQIKNATIWVFWNWCPCSCYCISLVPQTKGPYLALLQQIVDLRWPTTGTPRTAKPKPGWTSTSSGSTLARGDC